MADGDDDDKEIISSTESEGAGGQDPGEGDDDSEVSAEHADDQENDGESEVDAEPAKNPGRAESRIQRLANETKAAREEAAAARREAEELRRAHFARQQQQTQAERDQMMALMTPEERADYRIKEFEGRQAHLRQQDQIQTASMMDKMAFDAKAAVHPVYAKYKDLIEEQFAKQMAQGRPVEREILLQNHLGKLALEGAGKSGQAKRQAARRVESQKVSSGSGRGDAQSNRGRAGDTAENRLKGVII